MFKLVAQDGTEYPITSPVTTFGREECDVLLPNDESVSRRHAKVERQGDALVLVDLDSTNGTFVNNVRLSAPYTLQPGDVVRLGNTRLTFQEEGKAPATQLIGEPPPWQVPAAPGPEVVSQPQPMPGPLPQPAPGPVPYPPSAARPGFAPQPQPTPGFPPQPVPGPGFIPQPVPAPVYQGPMTYGQPTKDKTIAYILEVLLLGLGWIYAGETGTGIAILVCWIVVGLGIGITVDIATAGLGCLCTGPLAIAAYALSLVQLSKYINSRPHIFR